MSHQKDIVTSKLQKAFESVEEAKVLFEHGFYNSVASHLYYALFYAALSATLSRGIITKTHSGTKNQFHQTFVKDGIVSIEHGKLYDRLMRLRTEGDYGDFAVVTKMEVQPLFESVNSFLEDIRKLISDNR